MPNLGALLKSEITRLSRKAAREQLAPLQSASASHRRQIANLKKQVALLEREVKSIRKAAGSGSAKTEPTQSAPATRFVPKGLVTLRTRLGLTAESLARLLDVSAQSIYNWEHKRATPRKAQLAAIAELRGIGKKVAQARLAALAYGRAAAKAGR